MGEYDYPVLNFSQGFRAFAEGLDKHLIWDYFIGVKEHAWELFWGAGVPGIVVTIYTLYQAPAKAYIPWAITWAVFVAGYYIWRADHIRLIPKFEIKDICITDTPTADGNRAAYVQLVPRCLTDAPVTECRGSLLRVHKRYEYQSEWTLTAMDEPLKLKWSNYGVGALTLQPGQPQRLNVCFAPSNYWILLPDVEPMQSRIREVFDSTGIFRFDIQVTATDCSPVDVSVVVTLDQLLEDRKPKAFIL
jgi:hypothetical protein